MKKKDVGGVASGSGAAAKKNKQVTYLWAQESCRKMAGRQYVSAKEGST